MWKEFFQQIEIESVTNKLRKGKHENIKNIFMRISISRAKFSKILDKLRSGSDTIFYIKVWPKLILSFWESAPWTFHLWRQSEQNTCKTLGKRFKMVHQWLRGCGDWTVWSSKLPKLNYNHLLAYLFSLFCSTQLMVLNTIKRIIFIFSLKPVLH